MFAVSRVILTVGCLVVSASIADARESIGPDFPAFGPVPSERPMLLEGFPPHAATAASPSSSKQVRSLRRGRRSRLVETVAPTERRSLATGTEAASETPAESRGAAAEGPREAASPTLNDLVARHAQENGVPIGLAQAVVRIESRGNVHAANGGALGLMQIKPGTARAAGFSGGASGLFVADTNLHFGMKILGEAYRAAGGNVCLALMRYQSGHLATRMTSANRAYCSRARAVMAGA